jgi:radical SAM superfamily enzyme YgiQ (UPF0313 family)
MEFTPRQGPEEQCAALLSAAPRILGLSVSVWNHRQSLEILAALDKAWPARRDRPTGRPPRPVVVLGGPEASFLPPDAEIFNFADFVIRGEGEGVFAELCRLILEEPEDRGVESGAPKRAAPEPPQCVNAVNSVNFIDAEPPDLSGVNTAYRLYTAEDLGNKLIYVEASRGCPFGCDFCQGSADSGLREFPLEPFLKDMELLLERCAGTPCRINGGLRTFKFLDRSFNAKLPRAVRIMDFFSSAARRRAFQVHFEMVPSLFPPELKRAAARFPPGSLRLEIGLQTLNPKTAALIRRPGAGLRIEEELENLRFLRFQTGAIIHVDLIAGLPGEDLASFAGGFDRLWIALTGGESGEAEFPPPDRPEEGAFEIQMGILKCLPGTPLRRHDGDYGMVYAPQPPYEVIETAALTKAELDRIKNFARFWELIAGKPWKAASGRAPRGGGKTETAENPAAPLLRPGKPVFRPFMELADGLWGRFGRNWGIDRNVLRAEVERYLAKKNLPGKGGEETWEAIKERR